LSLSILPSPSFSAEDVSVSNVQGGQADKFITLKSVDVNVAFFPLLRGEVQVKKFILIEPVVAIEVDADGKGNWEFGAEDANQSPGNSTTELSFEQFQIENGQVSYQDFASGTKELVRMINASVTMDSLQGPFEVSGNARYKNLPVSTELMVGTIREDRKIPINVSAALMDDDINIKFTGGLLPDETSPQADGKITLDAGDIGDLFLASALLDIENTEPVGPRYNHPLSLESSFAYGGDAINISALEFEMGDSRGTGNLTATFGELNRFDGNLSVNSFDLDSFLPNMDENEQAANASGNAGEEIDYSILDQIEGNFIFKLGALQYNEKIASQLDLNLTASQGLLDITNGRINMPGGSELSLEGAIGAPDNNPEFNGDITLNSGNLRAFLEWLKIDVSEIPAGRLTRLAYKGSIKADPQLIQLYGIDGSLDTFQYKGGLSYALQDRPAMGMDIAVQNLNIDNYIQPSEEAGDLKQSLRMFGDFDANYKIDLTNITAQGITIKKIALNGELYGGSLNAKTINIEDYAGFDLNGSLIASGFLFEPEFETSFNTTAASLVPLQRAFRFQAPFDISEVGAVAVNARITGNFEKVNVDIKSTVGSSKADIKGEVTSAAEKQLPEIGNVDLTIIASNPSLASLIDQFDLPVNKAKANDDRSFGVNTKLTGNLDTVDIDGTLSVAGGSIALKGRSNLVENELSSFDLAVDIAGPDLNSFVRGLGMEFNPSNTELGPLAIKMAASGTSSDLSLKDINGNIGPTKVSGSGEITGLDAKTAEGEKRGFDFNLALDDVPVEQFMEATVDNGAADEDWGNWSKDPMELAVMNDYDGRATITADSIVYDKYNFESPRFDAVLKDGVLNITNFTGKLFGGDVAIAGNFSSAGDLDMDMSIKNAAIVDATTSFAGIEPISGYFDMNQKIIGKGTSQEALISSLTGTGQVTATPGIIHGINLPELNERLKGLDNQNGLLGLLASTLSGGETPYEGGASTMTMENGALKLSPLDIKMLGAQSIVNLGIDLAEWNMDMGGDLALSEHPDAPPIGMSILGAIHNPEIAYNTKQLEGFIGQKIAANLLQNMVEGNGGIGDLFGGIGGAVVPGAEAPIPPTNEGAVTSNPLGSLLDAVVNVPEAEVVEEEPAPAPKKESVEELGLKLLDRLFQKPAPTPPD
ncbi:MAG: AsmA family protein, partial [Kordiimonadaceae bacterium]|nr:AsmA family protein [Kordiimonadaceae bacterium]